MPLYAKGLTDTATFYQKTESQNDYGQAKEADILKYQNIPCRLSSHRIPNAQTNEGAIENFIVRYTVQVEIKYDDIERGDTVKIDDSKYLIIEQRKLKGLTSTPKLILYYIEKITDET